MTPSSFPSLLISGEKSSKIRTPLQAEQCTITLQYPLISLAWVSGHSDLNSYHKNFKLLSTSRFTSFFLFLAVIKKEVPVATLSFFPGQDLICSWKNSKNLVLFGPTAMSCWQPSQNKMLERKRRQVSTEMSDIWFSKPNTGCMKSHWVVTDQWPWCASTPANITASNLTMLSSRSAAWTKEATGMMNIRSKRKKINNS